jgi:hypothetical protein
VTAQTSTSEVTSSTATTAVPSTTTTTDGTTTTSSTTSTTVASTTTTAADESEVTTSTTAVVPTTIPVDATEDDTSTAATWIVVVLIAVVLVAVLVRVLGERSSDEATTKRWADEERLAMQRVESLRRRVVALIDLAGTSSASARATLASAVLGDVRRGQGELDSLARRAPNERAAIAVRAVEDELDDVAATVEVLGDASSEPSPDMLALATRACSALEAAVAATV